MLSWASAGEFTHFEIHANALSYPKYYFIIAASWCYLKNVDDFILMGEGFMGGVHPLYDLFWFPTLFFKIWKRFFASVIKIISGIYG